MTIDQAKNKLASWCLEQVGYHEGNNNWNKYAEGKTPAYGWNVQNQPWCDVFVDAAFIENFGKDAASVLTYQPYDSYSALCSASADFYKAHSAFKPTPEVGDQVFFYYSGGINHTGIVVSVSGGVVTTVEGNSSDSVRKNAYAVGASIIAGYGRPNWAAVVDGNEDPEEDGTPAEVIDHTDHAPAITSCTFTATMPIIRSGSIGWPVKIMQTAIIGHGFSCGWCGADGEVGERTLQGLKAFQLANGLTSDGICGEQTWAKLLNVNAI
jgi:peptidoglycan hydrolase-like protein with peptidoglycan-binding domain